MSKSNVNPNHYKVAGRERQGEDILQGRHKQKHTQSLVPGRSAAHARRDRPALIPGPPPRGAAPLKTAKLRMAKRTANTAAKKENAATRASRNKQGSDKRGTRSTAQKRASSRHDFEPIPATRPVGGAFGKEPSARRRKPRRG